jgi:hypothetical protein
MTDHPSPRLTAVRRTALNLTATPGNTTGADPKTALDALHTPGGEDSSAVLRTALKLGE